MKQPFIRPGLNSQKNLFHPTLMSICYAVLHIFLQLSHNLTLESLGGRNFCAGKKVERTYLSIFLLLTPTLGQCTCTVVYLSIFVIIVQKGKNRFYISPMPWEKRQNVLQIKQKLRSVVFTSFSFF